MLHGNTVWDYLSELAYNTDKSYLISSITHEKILDTYNKNKEREELIKEITNRVIERISVDVNVENAILEINKLKQSIDNLGK